MINKYIDKFLDDNVKDPSFRHQVMKYVLCNNNEQAHFISDRVVEICCEKVIQSVGDDCLKDRITWMNACQTMKFLIFGIKEFDVDK